MSEEIERIEQCFLDFGMQRMSKYFGKKKKCPGGMLYYNLLWDRHDQYYYVTIEDNQAVIWCSRNLGTDMEKADNFSCGLSEDEIKIHVEKAANFILSDYKVILAKYIQLSDNDQILQYKIPDEDLSDSLSVTDEGLYKINVQSIKKENIKQHEKAPKESFTADELWDELRERLFESWEIEDYSKSLKLSKALYDLAVEVTGIESIHTAIALLWQATTYQLMNDYMSALTTDEEIFNMSVIREPEYSELYVDCLKNIIGDCELTGNDCDLKKYTKIYIDYCIENYGENDDKTLAAILNSISLYLRTGNIKQAYYSAKTCYSKYSDLYGSDDEKTLDALYWIAKIFSFIGIYDEGIRIQSMLYKTYCRLYGENSEKTIDCISSLAVILRYSGVVKDAIILFRYVMLKYRQLYGDASPECMFSKYELGLALLKDNKNGQARGYFKECEKTLKKLPEDYSHFHFELQMSLARAEKDGRHKDNALSIYNKLYEEFQPLYGDYDNRTIRVLSAIISLTFEDDYEKTKSLLEKQYSIECVVNGEKDMGTLITLSNLSYINSILGNPQKALEQQIKVYDTAREVYGEFDPETMFFEKNLIIRFNEAGNFKEALQRASKAYLRRREYLGAASDAAYEMRQLCNKLLEE